MAVVRGAADGDEQLARHDRARVGRDAGEGDTVAEPDQLAARGRQHLVQSEDDLGTQAIGRCGHA